MVNDDKKHEHLDSSDNGIESDTFTSLELPAPLPYRDFVTIYAGPPPPAVPPRSLSRHETLITNIQVNKMGRHYGRHFRLIQNKLTGCKSDFKYMSSELKPDVKRDLKKYHKYINDWKKETASLIRLRKKLSELKAKALNSPFASAAGISYIGASAGLAVPSSPSSVAISSNPSSSPPSYDTATHMTFGTAVSELPALTSSSLVELLDSSLDDILSTPSLRSSQSSTSQAFGKASDTPFSSTSAKPQTLIATPPRASKSTGAKSISMSGGFADDVIDIPSDSDDEMLQVNIQSTHDRSGKASITCYLFLENGVKPCDFDMDRKSSTPLRLSDYIELFQFFDIHKGDRVQVYEPDLDDWSVHALAEYSRRSFDRGEPLLLARTSVSHYFECEEYIRMVRAARKGKARSSCFFPKAKAEVASKKKRDYGEMAELSDEDIILSMRKKGRSSSTEK